MAFKPRFNDPSVLIRIGSASLLASALVKWFAQPAAGAWRDTIDGVFGLLTGVAIGTLLLAVRLNSRRSSGPGDPPGA